MFLFWFALGMNRYKKWVLGVSSEDHRNRMLQEKRDKWTSKIGQQEMLGGREVREEKYTDCCFINLRLHRTFKTVALIVSLSE